MLTLNDLEEPFIHHRKPVIEGKISGKKKIWNFLWESIKVGFVILWSFLFANIFVNATLYKEKLYEFINGVQKIGITKFADNAHSNTNSKDNYLDQLFKSQGIVRKQNVKDHIYAYYNSRPQTLDFQFNILPPGKRIIIPDLGIQAPIQDVDGDVQAKMEDGLFSDELKQGVVHYPTTPEPNEPGTTMIFWHTSNYFWVKSAYNTVFSKIPQLKAGQTIQVIWNGKLYEYEVKEQEIVKPNEVPEAYAQNFDSTKKRLAIMGCYPVGTSDKRIIVFAEPKARNNQVADLLVTGTSLAYHDNQYGQVQ
jgi:LPXTG-site transpeptidase (sortase) family protein